VDAILAVAPDLQTQRKLDAWATAQFKGMRAYVFTYPELERQTRESLKVFYAILNVAFGLLLSVVTLMVAMLINIYLSQRSAEFALLQTLGLTRWALMFRAMSEGALVIVLGWFAGVGLAYTVLTLVNESIMVPRAFLLNPLDLTAYFYTLCVPSAILLTALATVWMRFKKFDPIAVIERRVV
ncbi:MAG: FtsX-like permease family protein, partial [Candidatus Caldarchaeum sp.]